MHIQRYAQAQDIPDALFPSLIDVQIECWGQSPFNEYKMCDDCGALYSLEEVCGSIDLYRGGCSTGNDFCCTECSGTTSYVYPKDAFLELAKNYVQGQISAALVLSSDEKVEGFSVISLTSFEKLMENEFGTRPDAYVSEEVIPLLQEATGCTQAYDRVVCLHQVYLSPVLRGRGIATELLIQLFSLHAEYEHIPVVLETRYDSDFYPITRALGFKNIIHDKFGYVIQVGPTYGELLQKLLTPSPEVSNEKNRFRHEAQGILGIHPNFLSRRFYS